MKADFSEFIKTVKAKNDIVEVVGSYVKLERKGYNYWACCPFHHERTPSFSVNAADGYYHCFGCGVSGDVIGFVKDYENLEFMQAVEILAKRAGLEITAFDDKSGEEIAVKKQKKDRLLSLLRDAARFYLNNLYSGKASAQLEYLEKRGIAPSTMKKFGLGASLDYFSLPLYLRGRGYSEEECVESGACVKTEEGRIIDAEGERLIIPIINALDEVVAFGGRVMKKTDRAKYKNTRETAVFEKSKNLYNINLVKKEKRVGGIPYLIMVEGYMDAMSLYQAGFKCVAASMGTSLTKEQARLCKRYADTVLISYDGDFAGQKANLRGLDILNKEGLKVRVVPMPDGMDPDDVIQKRGAEGYQKCLDAAMPLLDFRILAARRKYDLTRSDEGREFIKEVLPIVRESDSAAEREVLLKRVAEWSKVSVEALQRDLENIPARAEPQETRESAPPPREADRDEKAVCFVLAACLFNQPYALGFHPEDLYLDGDFGVIADFIASEREKGRVRASGVFEVLSENSPVLNEILSLNDGGLEGDSAEKYFKDSVRMLKRREIIGRISLANAAYAQAETSEEQREILRKIGDLRQELKRWSNGRKR